MTEATPEQVAIRVWTSSAGSPYSGFFLLLLFLGSLFICALLFPGASLFTKQKDLISRVPGFVFACFVFL